MELMEQGEDIATMFDTEKIGKVVSGKELNQLFNEDKNRKWQELVTKYRDSDSELNVTILKLLNCSCNFRVVPGVTVDLNNTILSSRSLISEISCSARFTISKFIEPSLFDGVGTDKNINSDLFTVSSIVSTDFDVSLS